MGRWLGIGLIVAVLLGVAWFVWPDDSPQLSNQSPDSTRYAPPPGTDVERDINAQVWTKHGYDGPSFEYKVNCGPDYDTLNECFLNDLTRVTVTSPDGSVTELDKDFNIQEYSGEITRRWVIYGPANAGFPVEGDYQFSYYRGEELVFSQSVPYESNVIAWPTDILWTREGGDLLVTWTPPPGVAEGMTYKVILFPDGGDVISQLLPWDATSARLVNIPLAPGTEIGMNVAVYFEGGYAYPENIDFEWQ